MCHQRLFEFYEIFGKESEGIEPGKNHSWLQQLFERNSQGRWFLDERYKAYNIQ